MLQGVLPQLLWVRGAALSGVPDSPSQGAEPGSDKMGCYLRCPLPGAQILPVPRQRLQHSQSSTPAPSPRARAPSDPPDGSWTVPCVNCPPGLAAGCGRAGFALSANHMEAMCDGGCRSRVLCRMGSQPAEGRPLSHCASKWQEGWQGLRWVR